MRKLFDDSGEEVEVPDVEELKKLEEASKKVVDIEESINKIREKVGAKEGQDIDEVLDKIKEEANPNFASLRQKLKDKEGELKTAQELLTTNKIEFEKANPEINIEEVTKNAEEAGKKAATTTLIENELGKRMSGYDEKQIPVIRKDYDKLIAGEDVSLENLGGFIDKAIKSSGVEIESNSRDYVDGKPPTFREKSGEDFAETDAGKEIGKSIYGEDFGKSAEERKGEKE